MLVTPSECEHLPKTSPTKSKDWRGVGNSREYRRVGEKTSFGTKHVTTTLHHWVRVREGDVVLIYTLYSVEVVWPTRTYSLHPHLCPVQVTYPSDCTLESTRETPPGIREEGRGTQDRPPMSKKGQTEDQKIGKTLRITVGTDKNKIRWIVSGTTKDNEHWYLGLSITWSILISKT